MNELDEEDVEDDINESSEPTKNKVHDSRFETRSQEIPFKYGLDENK